ncbi:MAG TPA: PEGA domain-containing protein [Polyangiaceae bacterium]|jgi:hypothetical protein|nr:PEGA domain-containing protein [Polyangiaceae bacterium]
MRLKSQAVRPWPRLSIGVGLLAAALSQWPSVCRAAPGATSPTSTTAAPAPKKAAAGAPAKKAGGAAPQATAGGPDAATKKGARDAYAAGEKAYTSGDYTTAYDEFKKAHDLIPTIHAEYWMAMAASYGSDPGAAYQGLSDVVASPEASKLGDDKLASATARLDELKKTPAAVNVTSTPPGAEVSVDGAAQPGTTPVIVNVLSGTHRLALGLKGYDKYETDLTVTPGQKLDQNVELTKSPEPVPVPVAAPVPAPAKPPPPAPPPKQPKNVLPAYITLGVGAVGAIVGTVFGVEALSAKSDFNKNPTNSNADRAERDALIADMGFAVALTLGITGIVLLVSDDSSEVTAKNEHAHHPARARLDIAPMITHSTQGAAARLTF